jgi:N-methylhydantoinase A
MREAEARCDADPSWTRSWFLRARFVGQGHELDVPAEPGDMPAAIAERFAALHRQRVGFTLPADVEIVSARCAASDAPRAARLERRGDPWDAGSLTDGGGPCEARLAGPCSVVLPDATMFAAEGWTATALSLGGWMLERVP